jgi:DNA-binding transcriptional MerR regulator
MTKTYSIGELASATDTKVETIRYYERVGLLPKPKRTPGNYRRYEADHLGRLSFTRRARDLGFSIEQVRNLISLGDQRDRSCETVDAIAREHRPQGAAARTRRPDPPMPSRNNRRMPHPGCACTVGWCGVKRVTDTRLTPRS